MKFIFYIVLAMARYRQPPKFTTQARKRTRPKVEPTGDWSLVGCDPMMFTQMFKKIGVKGAQIEELWSIDDSIFENIRPVHGLIFLFKYIQEDEPSLPIVTDERTKKIYFAKQVVKNACATQAIICLLLNCTHPDIIIGPELTKLKEFSMCLEPKLRGLALSNSQVIRNAHNSMGPQSVFEVEAQANDKKVDVYHFIAYMPIDGHLYEFNGIRDGPIDRGIISPKQDWLDVVRPIIMKRINVYTEGEIHFNLMALVSDKKVIYERQMQDLIAETQMISIQSVDVGSEIQRLKMLIEYENVKIERYKTEMIRRRHNYLPFLVALLKVLSEEKKLMPLFEKAKERALRKGTKKMKV